MGVTTKSRAEQEVFDELAALCGSPGYAEVIARFCLRDNLLLFGSEGMNAKALTKTYAHERLIRTELSTLIGLMIRQGLDLTAQSSDTIDAYCEQTEALLQELHNCMSGVGFAGLTPDAMRDPAFNPFKSAEALREPIFYGAESAYPFQYRDLAILKYAADDGWLQANRGFTTSNAHRVMQAVQRVQRDRAADFLLGIRARQNPSALSAFSFSLEQVARAAGLSAELVKPVLDAFALDPADRNPTFRSLSDFNATNATPIVRTGESEYFLLQLYSLLEAFYDSPFFWMMADKAYRSTASTNRGVFAESFATTRLARVFSRARVFQNVTIPGGKGETLGEIDVLALFGDRVIVVQAKSKRLTLEARKGNDQQLQKDFKGAVQDACDQAMACSELLLQPGVKLVDDRGRSIPLEAPVRRVYPVCLVSDHYPALAFQARQFLTVPPIEKVATPFVMDVFTLDVLTEMLTSPLRFLSYLELHAAAGDQFLISGELTLLGYHLARNLWVEEGVDMVMLHDDVAASLDAAMMVRREGVPGPRTPEGVLTRLEGTSVGRFIHAIDAEPNPAVVGLGMFLLELGEDSVRMASDAMDRTCAAARRDLKSHNASFPVGSAGITIHANTWTDVDAMDRLREYCEMRKYEQKAERWFGISLDVESGRPRLGLMLDEPWVQDDAMDVLVSGMQKAQPIHRKMPQLQAKKPGRNDLCPCGSGLKFKKCHLRA